MSALEKNVPSFAPLSTGVAGGGLPFLTVKRQNFTTVAVVTLKLKIAVLNHAIKHIFGFLGYFWR